MYRLAHNFLSLIYIKKTQARGAAKPLHEEFL